MKEIGTTIRTRQSVINCACGRGDGSILDFEPRRSLCALRLGDGKSDPNSGDDGMTF